MTLYVYAWEKPYSNGAYSGQGSVQVAGDIRQATAQAQLEVSITLGVSPNQVLIRDIQRIDLIR